MELKLDICARADVEAFAKNNGFEVIYKQPNNVDDDIIQFSYLFESEDHTQSLYAIAKFICEHCLYGDHYLAVVDNMKVWASQRDELLINLVRAHCFRKKASLFTDGAAFTWTQKDLAAATSVVHLALLFGWDMYLHVRDSSDMVFISHDGYFDVFVESDRSDIERHFNEQTGRVFERIA